MPSSSVPDPSRPATTVLVVEDEFLIRMTLAEVLADEGYVVMEAGSGDDALQVLHANPAIAVLLTDIQLPGSLDGRALARKAREGRPDLPVLFMTGRSPAAGSGQPDSRAATIAKPYLPSDICNAVRRLLDTAVPAPG